jgi:hypothetical protein
MKTKLIFATLLLMVGTCLGEGTQSPRMERIMKATEEVDKLDIPKEAKRAIYDGLLAGAEAEKKIGDAELAKSLGNLSEAMANRPTETQLSPPSKFIQWMKASSMTPGDAEYTRDEFKRLLWKLKDDGVKVVTKNGKVIGIDLVTMLSPSGLRFVGDDGVSVVPFSDLPDFLVSGTAWTPEIEKRYVKVKEMAGRDANRAIAAERASALREENKALSSAPSPPPSTSSASVSSVPADVLAGIKADAARSWPSDYTMQEFVIGQQETAWKEYQTIKRVGINGVPPAVLSQIIAKAESSWKRNYEMIVFVIKEQTKAFEKVRR